MKAIAAGYARAESLEQAISLLVGSDGEARILAGGQSLVPAMNLGLAGDALLIDINPVRELRGIRVEDGQLVIGALTRHVELQADPLVALHAPLLRQAVSLVGHPAIRARGTIGGSLANADPAAELPAAILCLGGEVVAAGPEGERVIAAESFFQDVFVTDLAPDEMIKSVRVPLSGPRERFYIDELSRRMGDFALAGLVLLRRETGHRAVFFGTGPTPMLARGAMAALDAGDVEAAVAALDADIDPMTDTQASASYRRHVAGVLLRRGHAEIEGADK